MSRSYDEAAAHPRQLRGRLSAIGVGPGDSELLTVKAVRALQAADVVADHQAPGRLSHALRTVTPYLDHQRLLALEYPVATGPTSHPEGYQGALAEFYDTAERLLRAELAAGKTVALIAAGDPLIYSSQQHLSRRLTGDYPVDIISGISSFQAAAAATRSVLCEDRDVFRVVPATLPLAELTAQLCSGDPLAVLKLGRTTDTLVSALRAVDRLEHALVVSFASTPHEQIIPLTEALSKGGLLPYFSVVLLPSAALADGVVREENAPAEERVDVVGLGPGTPNFSPRTRRIFSPKLLMWWATPPIHNESR
ncbi:precorrin-2 C(20)-methyltransferase [Lawsonella clevelandensis]|uniref:precorrin-2 C(20)-methyltransferase n=1 Tax=Lawsonella clevelandensis TaxID=1528099 RepID=UPI0023F5704A|nr:precorrin-2 C(20)-methyltransferase [Lawsonella clevelandensis]